MREVSTFTQTYQKIVNQVKADSTSVLKKKKIGKDIFYLLKKQNVLTGRNQKDRIYLFRPKQ